MSSNQAVADRVECYMDELVECFEDFVKKSLLVITVGIAVVVGMLLYMLKVLTDREPTSDTTPEFSSSAPNLSRNINTEDYQKRFYSRSNRNVSPGSKLSSRKSSCKITPAVNTTSNQPLTQNQSSDEKVLNNIGLSSFTKLHACDSTNSNSFIPCRVPSQCTLPQKYSSVDSIGHKLSKHHMASMPIYPKEVPKTGSCCSLCCNDEN
ncbi:uncharacterized protein LOC120629655 [Pararge aegeria]|uniref:uncharacterized protein LOC120629655 n=1 Tax=Pararge aegeria TaxID=116150 RepID=UPI0019D0C0B3|nr:uncharacterized protein LOC120629655 [Pararge aegeria]